MTFVILKYYDYDNLYIVPFRLIFKNSCGRSSFPYVLRNGPSFHRWKRQGWKTASEFVLHKKGYPMVNIPNSRKLRYYQVLHEAQVNGNLRPFLEFMSELMEENEVML